MGQERINASTTGYSVFAIHFSQINKPFTVNSVNFTHYDHATLCDMWCLVKEEEEEGRKRERKGG